MIVKHLVREELRVPARAIRNFIDYVKKMVEENPNMAFILMPLIEKLDPWLVSDYEKCL